MKKSYHSRHILKIFSGFMVFSLLISMLGSLSGFASSAEEGSPTVWNGNKENTEFAGGNGTEENPYLISDGSQLYAMVNMYKAIDGVYDSGDPGVKYFKLTKDIYLNSTESFENWANSAPANKWLEGDCWFKGHLDGNGKTVYGLYADTGTYVGFIQTLCEGGSIKNLRFKNAYVKGTGYCGVIVARTAKPTGGTGTIVDISRCSVTESVVIAGTYNAAGGIVGAAQSNDCNISNCFFADGSLSSNQVGGIVGDGWTGNKHISYCFSAGYYPVGCPSTSNLAKFSFINVSTDRDKNNTDISSTYVTVLATEQMQGSGAVDWMGLDTNVWSDTDGYPELKSILYVADGVTDWKIPSDVSAINYESGDGTQENPYIIKTADQLYKMVAEYGKKIDTDDAGYFSIANDIYLNDVSDYTEWKYNPPANNWYNSTRSVKENIFIGNIDGNGHTVYGLYASAATDGGVKFAGLIQNIDTNTQISNLHIKKAYIVASYAGAFIGSIYATSGKTEGMVNLTGCSADSTVSVAGCYVGGFIGCALANINVSDCYFAGSVVNTGTGSGQSKSGIYGNLWNNSKYKHTIKNTYCRGIYPLVENKISTNGVFENVYFTAVTDYGKPGVTLVSSYREMQGLDASLWYWVDKKAPLLRSRGSLIFDVSGDDNSELNDADLAVMRKYLLSVSEYQKIISDINKDGESDIRDLISLKKKY